MIVEAVRTLKVVAIDMVGRRGGCVEDKSAYSEDEEGV